jgi:hypothetical protein
MVKILGPAPAAGCRGSFRTRTLSLKHQEITVAILPEIPPPKSEENFTKNFLLLSVIYGRRSHRGLYDRI